jgi:small-conductance mechanosensitive channel
VSWFQQFWSSPYRIPAIVTAGILVIAWLVAAIGGRIINRAVDDPRQRYSRRQTLRTTIVLLAAAAAVVIWAWKLPHPGTFLGLVGAGLAVALKDPLLAIAGRIAISAGRIYGIGDRIEINQLTGDVIDLGLFYTRMMELGNWIGGDQPSGRTVQFSNSLVFGANPVFNYTQDFAYIWDEVQIPVTYDSNIRAMSEILSEVGNEYTQDFLKGAEAQLEGMRRYFLVPSVDLKPTVYIEVTSNWVQLTMRYVVAPKDRRSARSFIFGKVFERIQGRKDISIGSSTMDLTVHGKPRSSSDEEPGEADEMPPIKAA